MPVGSTARPRASDRSMSSQSLARETSSNLPTHGHKGSSNRLHKPHTTAGLGRHGHPRVPSHGKGLNKAMMRLPSGQQIDDETLVLLARQQLLKSSTGGNGGVDAAAKHQGLPSNTHLDGMVATAHPMPPKRNKSALALSRHGSGSMSSRGFTIRHNMSHGTLSRNVSTAKLGASSSYSKSHRAFLAAMKAGSGKHGTTTKAGRSSGKRHGQATFELGDDDQDEEWTEESASQSPATIRTTSRPKTPVTPILNDTPDLQGSPESRISSTRPLSPPSATTMPTTPQQESTQLRRVRPSAHASSRRVSAYSQPPDAEAVTNRLLRRTGSRNSIPQTSNVSANASPRHIGSPHNTTSQSSTCVNDTSMPANGVSHFLSAANESGAGTPGSVSYLQQNLANLDRSNNRARSPSSKLSPRKVDARRIKSAANLTHSRLNDRIESHGRPKSPLSRSPPGQNAEKLTRDKEKASNDVLIQSSKQTFDRLGNQSAQKTTNAGISDSEQYRGVGAEAAQGMANTYPLAIQEEGVGTGGGVGVLDVAGVVSTNPVDVERRIRRQYEQARKDVETCRRFYPDIIISRIPALAVETHRQKRKTAGQSSRKDTDQSRTRDKSKSATSINASHGQTPSSARSSSVNVHNKGKQAAAGSSASSSSKKTNDARPTPRHSSAKSQSRVRFDVGGQSFDQDDDGAQDHENGDETDDTSNEQHRTGQDVRALLQRMWLAGGPVGEVEA